MEISRNTALRLLLSVATFGLPARAPSQVTPDGRYAWATVNKTGDWNVRASLVIQSTVDGWRKEVPGAGGASLTEDGKTIIYLVGDSLVFLTLGTDQETFLKGVASFEGPRASNGRRMVYAPTSAPRDVVLRDLTTGTEQRFAGVSRRYFLSDGAVLVLARDSVTAGVTTTELEWVDLGSGDRRVVWSGSSRKLVTPEFTDDGRQMAFTVTSESGPVAIWHYRSGEERATILVDDATPGIETGYRVTADPIRFSPKGKRLFFNLVEPPLDLGDTTNMVDVWSYLDTKVQSQQFTDLFPHHYPSVVGIEDRRVMRLVGENEVTLPSAGAFAPNEDFFTDDYALVCRFDGDVVTYDKDGLVVETYTMNEYNWNKGTQSTVYLVSLEDGSRTELKAKIKPTHSGFPYFRFSPNGDFVVSYDQQRRSYFSYHIASGAWKELTENVSAVWWHANAEAAPRGYYEPFGIRGWIGDSIVLLGDRYWDLWKVDLTDTEKPVNVTRGWGRRNNAMMFAGSGRSSFKPTDTLLAETRNDWTVRRYRNPGLVRVFLDQRQGDPQVLIPMGGPYRYAREGNSADQSIFMVSRQNAKEPPGSFYTRDFKVFTPVTNSDPEKRVGVGQELLTWRMFDGTETQGILYKPVDFDPSKKYPVVIYYYELQTGSFDTFRAPDKYGWLAEGYLVLEPDIHYKVGGLGQSTYNSIVSGAQYIGKLPYVDARRIGITGASFGGFETNYLVTHAPPNLFAAAISGCGVSNMFSYALTEDKDDQGYLYATGAEVGQSRLGTTMWERPDVYLASSSVFTADQATTPILLYNSYTDYRVPFSQSLELFKALRRLGKPAWLLQSGEDHCGGNYGDRFKQFFAHYLKGEPAPRWMTRGVPARKRGTDPGLDPDTTIATPGPGIRFEKEARTPEMEELVKVKKAVEEVLRRRWD